MRLAAAERLDFAAEAGGLYAQGLSLSEVAQRLGKSKSAVRRLLRSSEVALRAPSGLEGTKPKFGKTNACPPYGFKYQDGVLVEDTEERQTLGRIRAWLAAGRNPNWIASELNRLRIPSKKRKRWSRNAVSNLLTKAMI